MVHSFLHALYNLSDIVNIMKVNELTSTLSNERALHHGSTIGRLTESDFIYNGVFLNDRATLYAEPVSCRLVIFNDGSSTIRTYGLQ